MCGILDDIGPILAGVAGTIVGGPLGGALAGALVGGVVGAADGQGFGKGALGGAISGGLGGFGGTLSGALGSGAAGAGEAATAGVGSTSAGLDTSLLANVNTPSLSGLSASGFDTANLGAGAAGGSSSAAGAGFGSGLTQGSSLSGITASPSAITLGNNAASGLGGALGGEVSGAGASNGGAGGLGNAPTSTLNDVMNGGSTGGFGTGITQGTSTAGLTGSPTSTLSGLNTPTSSGVLSSPAAGGSMEGTQALAQQPGAVPGQIDLGTGGASLEGGQGAANAAPQQAAFAGPGTSATNANDFGMNGQVTGGSLGNFTTSGPVGAGGMGSKAMGGLTDFLQNNGQGLMKLFNTGLNAYQQYAKQQAFNHYTDQINQMYAPDSPYAKQMQETLARQDAAAGRNSQYGSRAVQLAAALTQGRSQALANPAYANAAMATPGANMLNGLFYNFGSNPQQLYNLGSAGFNGLSQLFG